MKRIISFALILALSLGVIPVTSFATNIPTLSFNSVQAQAGDTVSLTLSVENNPGIAGLAVSIKYDTTALTLTNTKKGSLFSGFTAAKNFAWDESENVTEDGVLATFTFTVSETASAGDYTIEIIPRSCTNEDLDDVEVSVINGKISIKLPTCDHTFSNNVCSKCGTTLNVSANGKFESLDTTATGNITVPLSSNGVCISSIGAGAFKNCASLLSVMLYDSVTEIADDAFEGVSDDFVIKCYEDSPASVWAEENGVAYEIVPVPYGNVNADGATDIFDLIALAKYIVGSESVIDTRAANTSAPDKADRTVDIFDLIALAKHICNSEFVLGPKA